MAEDNDGNLRSEYPENRVPPGWDNFNKKSIDRLHIELFGNSNQEI